MEVFVKKTLLCVFEGNVRARPEKIHSEERSAVESTVREVAVERLFRKLKPRDLSVLGRALVRFPPAHWCPNMIFRGAADRELKKFSKSFPSVLRPGHPTHPIFVLSESSFGHRVCPLSTKNYSAGRFVAKNCVLEITGEVLDRDSYLVEDCAFLLPEDPVFWKGLRFTGTAPQACIRQVGCERKTGSSG